MAEKLDPIKETVTIAGLTIANMWEAAAILELLEERGILTKQEVYDKIQDLRRKNPGKIQPDEVFLEPYLLTEIENQLMEDILNLFNEKGLTAHQAKGLLGRLAVLIEVGKRLAKNTSH